MATTFEITNIKLKKMNNLVAIQSDEAGRTIGFHSLNLEVAQLSEEAWQVFCDQQSTQHIDSNNQLTDLSAQSQAALQLQSWSQENQQSLFHKKNKIQSITLNVTQICNLHCTYCAAGGDGTFGDPIKKISIDKTLPQLQYFLKKLERNDSFQVTFLGGEPLLYPDGIEIVYDYITNFVNKESAEKNISTQFTIVTNGTLLNDKAIALIKKMRANLTISLDGDQKINDVVRPSKAQTASSGTTSKIIEGLQKVASIKSEIGKVGVSGVFTDFNHDLLSAYRFYRTLSVDWYDFTFDHKETRQEVSLVFTKSLQDVAREAYTHGGEKELRKIKFFDTYFQMLDSQVGVENYCGAGKDFLVIDAQNNIYPCPWLVGQKKELIGSGENLLQNEIKKYQEPQIQKPQCQDCWARHLCGGGCFYMHQNKTGLKSKIDENFCQRTQYLLALAILYYEKSRQLVEQLN